MDVGCGRGELLRGARDEGWRVAGIDMTSWDTPDPEMPIEVATVADARALDGRYDVVLLAGILEHLYEPVAALRRVRDALVPGGLAYIDVPNECGLWSRVGNLYMHARGRDWAVNLSPTFPPFHVVGLCPASLRYILEVTGFEVQRLELYSLDNRLAEDGGVGRLEREASAAILALGQALGMGAGIICWASRP